MIPFVSVSLALLFLIKLRCGASVNTINYKATIVYRLIDAALMGNFLQALLILNLNFDLIGTCVSQVGLNPLLPSLTNWPRIAKIFILIRRDHGKNFYEPCVYELGDDWSLFHPIS